jgi:tungstate transport system ATP-binding protein
MNAMRDRSSILPLRVENLRYVADGLTLLDGVGFSAARGGMTMLLGPNGAGKTLTLKLCHGILAPTSGEVRWALPGGAIEGRRAHAMLFQKPVMLRRSARGNIVHDLAAAGAPWRGRRAQAMAVLERFGMTEAAEKPARLMSGGEQQRLALARAVALKPEVLFLDEPSANLDPGATRRFEDLLAELKREGVTLIMSTHDLGQARRLADRVLFLHKGRLIEDAPADAFFAGPKTPEARAFLSGDLLW